MDAFDGRIFLPCTFIADVSSIAWEACTKVGSCSVVICPWLAEDTVHVFRVVLCTSATLDWLVCPTWAHFIPIRAAFDWNNDAWVLDLGFADHTAKWVERGDVILWAVESLGTADWGLAVLLADVARRARRFLN
jgi:hypothetical protein